jgi:hypothetical protein
MDSDTSEKPFIHPYIRVLNIEHPDSARLSKILLQFENIPLAIINSIRRSCLSLVPTVAFDYPNVSVQCHTGTHIVTHMRRNNGMVFVENSSVVHNEAIADRLLLIPLVQSRTQVTIESKFELFTSCSESAAKSLCLWRTFYNTNADASEHVSTINESYCDKSDPIEGRFVSTRDMHTVMPLSPAETTQVALVEAHISPTSGKEYYIPLTHISSSAPKICIQMKGYTVGTGLSHARFQPCAISRYEFVQEEASVVRDRFWLQESLKRECEPDSADFLQLRQYIETMADTTPAFDPNGQSPLSPEHQDLLAAYRDYLLLGAQRQYTRRPGSQTEPLFVLFGIDGKGMKPACQIVLESIFCLRLAVCDFIYLFVKMLSTIVMTLDPTIEMKYGVEEDDILGETPASNTNSVPVAAPASAAPLTMCVRGLDYTLGESLASCLRTLVCKEVDGITAGDIAFYQKHPTLDIGCISFRCASPAARTWFDQNRLVPLMFDACHLLLSHYETLSIDLQTQMFSVEAAQIAIGIADDDKTFSFSDVSPHCHPLVQNFFSLVQSVKKCARKYD